MDWHSSVLALIDLRSFSNLWFWIALAVMWSSASHYVLGVPFDMVVRARRQGGEAMSDLETITAIQARRRLHILATSGVWITGFWATVLTASAILGFGYRVEFAQALALMGFPVTLVFALGFRLALRIEREAPRNEALTRMLTWHRMMIQMIGTFSVLVTAIWGMWHNLSLSVLGR